MALLWHPALLFRSFVAARVTRMPRQMCSCQEPASNWFLVSIACQTWKRGTPVGRGEVEEGSAQAPPQPMHVVRRGVKQQACSTTWQPLAARQEQASHPLIEVYIASCFAQHVSGSMCVGEHISPKMPALTTAALPAGRDPAPGGNCCCRRQHRTYTSSLKPVARAAAIASLPPLLSKSHMGSNAQLSTRKGGVGGTHAPPPSGAFQA